MKIIKSYSWVYYMTEREYNRQMLLGEELLNLFPSACDGKWLIFCTSYDYAEKLCKHAVEECGIEEAKHSADFSGAQGVCCFYIPSDEIRLTKKFISFFKENDYLPKTKSGAYVNLAWKSNVDTRLGLYGGDRLSRIHLNDYIDLVSGEWTSKSNKWEQEEEKKSRILDLCEEYTGDRYSESAQLLNDDRINAEYIKDEMKKQGKTINEISSFLEVKDSTVRAWINGKTRPLIGNAMGLCLFLGLDISKAICKRT